MPGKDERPKIWNVGEPWRTGRRTLKRQQIQPFLAQRPLETPAGCRDPMSGGNALRSRAISVDSANPETVRFCPAWVAHPPGGGVDRCRHRHRRTGVTWPPKTVGWRQGPHNKAAPLAVAAARNPLYKSRQGCPADIHEPKPTANHEPGDTAPVQWEWLGRSDHKCGGAGYLY